MCCQEYRFVSDVGDKRRSVRRASRPGRSGRRREGTLCMGEKTATDADNRVQTADERCGRVGRLLWIIQEIRNDPRQSVQSLIRRAGVSRSQFYKDRRELQALGFAFEYKTGKGFQITEDRLTEGMDLTLSDRLLLMFALRGLYASGDGHLVARALEVGRKLANGLDEPFRTQILDEFDRVVIQYSYGCRPHVLEALEKAIAERRRVRVIYDSRRSGTADWREIDPLRLFFLRRALYLYARCPNHDPLHRTFRVSRIQTVHPTAIIFPLSAFNDDFYAELANAFECFMSKTAHEITLRFTGPSATYVSETLWHPSQRITKDGDDAILFTVRVAEPKEVEWWGRQFGGEVVG